MRIRLISVTILWVTILSCKTDRVVVGKYRSNFADIGFFVTVIDLKPDSTFHYVFSGDLTHTELDGTYKRANRILYLRFNKLKEDFKPLVFGTKENPDTILNFSDWQNSHSFDLKKEKNIEYHLKYRISGDKLKSYHIEKDRIVRKARYYTDRKRYILFGPSYHMRKWYLKRVN